MIDLVQYDNPNFVRHQSIDNWNLFSYFGMTIIIFLKQMDLFSLYWLGFILVTVFSSIGLFGTIMEIYCLSITYSIYSCIKMISYFLAIFFVSTIYSILFIIYLAIFITLIFIIMDLNQKNRKTNNDSTNQKSITNSSYPVF